MGQHILKSDGINSFNNVNLTGLATNDILKTDGSNIWKPNKPIVELSAIEVGVDKYADYAGKDRSDNGTQFSFVLPINYVSMLSADFIWIAQTTNASFSYNINLNWGANEEDGGANSAQDSGITKSVTTNNVYFHNCATLINSTNITGGDVIGCEMDSQSIDAWFMVSMRIRFYVS